MRCCALLFLALFFGCGVGAQKQPAPELRVVRPQVLQQLIEGLQLQQPDSVRLSRLLRIGRGFLQAGLPDSMLLYAGKALTLSKKLNNPGAESVASFLIIWAYRHMGRYPQALQAAFANLHRAEATKDAALVVEALRHVMFCTNALQEYGQTLLYARRAKQLVHSGAFTNAEEKSMLMVSGYLNFTAGAFEGLKQFDSSLHYRMQAYRVAKQLKNPQALAVTTEGLGRLYANRGLNDSALLYYRQCMTHVQEAGFRHDLAMKCQLGMAKIYTLQQRPDSSLLYARLALATAQRMKELEAETEVATLLHQLYAARQPKDSAYRYLLLATKLRDSLVNKEKIKAAENIKFTEALRRQRAQQAAQEAAARMRTRITTITVSAVAAVLLLAAFMLYRYRRLRHEQAIRSVFTKKLQQTELRALRAQMNPHFVFNCLNSINRYIVKNDHATAADYLSKFARLIRFILDNSAAESITLEKEIQTLQLYLQLEVLRFDRAFAYSVEVDEALSPEDISIPPMLLQPFVENAIWHGLLHKETAGGKVQIRFTELDDHSIQAEITDNGIGRKKAKALRSRDVLRNKSYGIKITGDRIFLLNELYHTAANVCIEDLTDEAGEGCGTRVLVTLPVKQQRFFSRQHQGKS